MMSAGRLRPNFDFRLSVKDAIGMSITPSMIFAMTVRTAQTPATTRSRPTLLPSDVATIPEKVWFWIAASPKPEAMSALTR